MVKSVQSVPHRGLRDWMVQRLSALVIMLYVFWLVFFLVQHHPLTFAEWHHLYSRLGMKVATVFFLAAFMWHAWIGIWTVSTDYIKPIILRGLFNLLVIAMLSTFFIWGLLIVGSV